MDEFVPIVQFGIKIEQKIKTPNVPYLLHFHSFNLMVLNYEQFKVEHCITYLQTTVGLINRKAIFKAMVLIWILIDAKK